MVNTQGRDSNRTVTRVRVNMPEIVFKELRNEISSGVMGPAFHYSEFNIYTFKFIVLVLS